MDRHQSSKLAIAGSNPADSTIIILSDTELADAMAAHVINRGGQAKDENGIIVCKNGAWAMMLEAARRLKRVKE